MYVLKNLAFYKISTMAAFWFCKIYLACIYIHIYMYICICICMYMCVYVYVRTCVYLYVYMCVYAYMYMCLCICMYMYVSMSMYKVHTCRWTHCLVFMLLRERVYFGFWFQRDKNPWWGSRSVTMSSRCVCRNWKLEAHTRKCKQEKELELSKARSSALPTSAQWQTSSSKGVPLRNSATSWGLSIQKHKPVETFLTQAI